MALAHDANVAGALGERGVDDTDRGRLYYGSRWIVLAKQAAVLTALTDLDDWYPLVRWEEARLWTDDFTDVLGALKWE
jgi:hypothetical protein